MGGARLIGPRRPGGKFYYRRPAVVKPRAKKAQMAKLPKSVAKAVKNIVSKQVETKFVTYTPVNNVSHNSTITGGDFYRVLPHVFQGATEFQRNGDKIKPLSLTVKGHVAINRDRIDDTRAIMVRVLILQMKSAHNYSAAGPLWATSGTGYGALLKQNDESGVENIPFSGNANELYLPVNRDMFDVLGERFIKLSQIAQSGTAVEAAPVNTIAKNFNIKIKHVPSTITYTAGGQTEPTNYAPFMCFGYSYMDGHPPDTGAFVGLEVNAQAHLYFKDG